MKYLTVLVASSFVSLMGCGSVPMDKAALAKVRKVAVVGYTLDYNMDIKSSLTSSLLGNEKQMGMLGKSENKLVESPVSVAAYNRLTTALKTLNWTVLDAERVAGSRSLREFNQKSVKVGYLPLRGHHERQERTGIAQYHYLLATVGKDQTLKEIAKELGVDTLAFAHFDTSMESFALGMGSYKYHSMVQFDLYDAVTDKIIAKFTFTGEKVKEVSPMTEFGGNIVEANTVLGVKQACDNLTFEIKKNM